MIVPSPTIKQHLEARAELYKRLAISSSSVEELLMKIELLGEKWTRWDWAAMLQYVDYYYVASCRTLTEANSVFALFAAICKCIKESSLLDKVIVDKEVIMSLIELSRKVTAERGSAQYAWNGKVPALLAAIFIKFPDLWNMSWMWSKCYVKTSHGKKFFKKHRLQFLLPGKDAKFYMSKEFYASFAAMCN